MTSINQLTNEKLDWNSFDSERYLTNNYVKLRPHNAFIVESISDYLSVQRKSEAHCIDVGTGANLYPSLALHPWAKSIEMYEPSQSNQSWLQKEIKTDGSRWKEYWKTLRDHSSKHYEELDWYQYTKKLQIVNKGLNDLPKDAFDIGSMFFVAESVTADQEEFVKYTSNFIQSIHQNGIALAAFMEGSSGYTVGEARYPAVKLDDQSFNFLRELLYDIQDIPVDRGDSPVRKGYTGMRLILGKVK